MKNILYLCQLYPSSISGGSWKSLNVIQGLLAAGYRVDVCCFLDDKLPKKEINHPNLKIFFVKKTLINLPMIHKFFLMIKAFFATSPLRMKKYFDPNMVKLLRRLQAEKKYNHAILDVGSSLQYLPLLFVKEKIIYIEQNIESDVVSFRRQYARWPLKIFWMIEEKLTKIYEKNYLSLVSEIWAISKEDKQKLVPITLSPVKVLPIALPWKDPSFPKKKIKTIIFLGLLSWPENELGLLWFLEHVWGKVKTEKPELQLIVGGVGVSKKLKDKMNKYNVNYQGFIKNIDNFFQKVSKHSIGIAPILSGSGLRIKILTYLQYGIPVVATTIGAQGIRQDLIAIADTDAEFARVISNYDFSTRKLFFQRTKRVLQTEYNESKLIQFLKKSLK